MKESRLRFTAQEKLAILKEVHLMGLEPTLRKYCLTTEALINWQRKFKGSKASKSIQLIKEFPRETKVAKPEKPVMNEKEEQFLRLVASLIVQCVLKKSMPDR
jgi:hypothetical protein